MYDIVLKRNECTGCKACVKICDKMKIDVDNKSTIIDSDRFDGDDECSVFEMGCFNTVATICPNNCIHIYDDNGVEIEIEKRGFIENPKLE
ncbi:MAG: ferredoxin [Methanobacteriaceae archaeon]|nr:ferredoxin [Methanobacteriaceae archaeon]